MADVVLAVLDKGWVVVGNLARQGEFYTISNGAIVREWGTTKGLGEIAVNGPTEKTKLDPCPMVRVKAPIMFMQCKPEAWHGHL